MPRSVAHDIASGRSLTFAAWAAADDDCSEHSSPPTLTQQLALRLHQSAHSSRRLGRLQPLKWAKMMALQSTAVGRCSCQSKRLHMNQSLRSSSGHSIPSPSPSHQSWCFTLHKSTVAFSHQGHSSAKQQA